MASDAPRAGTQLGMTIARHRIERLVGGGALGRVFVCRDPNNKVVAVKLLRTSHAALGDKLMEKRSALEKVRSPHVVVVHDVAVYNSTPYVVMELAEGGTLAEEIKKGPLRTVDALQHAREIALGMQAAWAQGVWHGDLRPQNVLLVEGHVKLVDFLLAPAVEGTTLRGTPAYMAPELMVGTPADALTDIYAFGMTLIECLTGKPAYTGAPSSVLQRQSSGPSVSLAALMSGAPHFLVELVDRLVAKDRAVRLKTWADVIDGIDRSMRGLSVKESKPQIPEMELDIDAGLDDELKTDQIHTSPAAKDLLDSIDDEPRAVEEPPAHAAATRVRAPPPSPAQIPVAAKQAPALGEDEAFAEDSFDMPSVEVVAQGAPADDTNVFVHRSGPTRPVEPALRDDPIDDEPPAAEPEEATRIEAGIGTHVPSAEDLGLVLEELMPTQPKKKK